MSFPPPTSLFHYFTLLLLIVTNIDQHITLIVSQLQHCKLNEVLGCLAAIVEKVEADKEKLTDGFLLKHDPGTFMGVLAVRLVEVC